jgi:hypothetical protein
MIISPSDDAPSPNESGKAPREAADFYKVDVAAITAKVRQEFAAKDRAKATAEDGHAEATWKRRQGAKSCVIPSSIPAEPARQAPQFSVFLPVCPPCMRLLPSGRSTYFLPSHAAPDFLTLSVVSRARATCCAPWPRN